MEKPNTIMNLSPFKKDLVKIETPPGITLKELLSGVPEKYHKSISLELNGEYVPNSYWEGITLSDSDTVNLYVRPFGGGGGSNDKNRLVAQIVVTAAAIAAIALMPQGTALWVKMAVAATIQIGGGLLINELFPISLSNEGVASPDEIGGTSIKSLSASKNAPTPYAILPKLYGTRRIVPPFVVNPRVEVVDNDQYLHLAYFLNYGPIQFNSFKVGVDENGNTISGGYNAVKFSKTARSLFYENAGTYYTSLSEMAQLQSDGKETISIGDTGVSIIEPETIVIGTADAVSNILGVDTELAQPNIRLMSTVLKSYDIGIPRVYEDRPNVEVDLTDYEGSSLDIKFQPDNNHNDPPYFDVWYKTQSNGTWQKFNPELYKEENPNLVKTYYKRVKIIEYDDEGNTYTAYIYEPAGTAFIGPSNWSTYILKLSLKDANGNKITDDKITAVKFSIVYKPTGDGGFTVKSIQTFDSSETSASLYTTASNTTKFDIHLYSDNGIYGVTDSGRKRTISYLFDVYYKSTSSSTWIYDGTVELSGNSRNPVRKVYTIEPGTPDSYDIKLIFKEAKNLTGNDIEYITWAFLQSYQDTSTKQLWGGDYTSPKIDKYPVFAYMKIKASQNLNGIIDNVSFFISGLVNNKIKNTGWEISDNPALAYVDVLCGPQVIKPLDYNINLDSTEIEEWYDWCKTNNFTINTICTTKDTLWQRLQRVSSVGLASPLITNNKFTIKRDKEGLVPSQVITPRNSWGFKATKSFSKIPHAAKMKFVNNTTWEEDYVIVYNYNEEGVYYDKFTASDFIEYSNLDITNELQATKYARYMLADMMLRPETYSVSMSVENIIVDPGDKVILAYDTIKVGQTFGRIKDKLISNGNVEAIIVDEPVEIGDNKSIIIRRVGQDAITTSISTVDSNRSNAYTIYFSSPIIDDFNIGDLFIYGDTSTIKLECKVRKINYNRDLTAELELVNAADNTEFGSIHSIYNNNNIPIYKPIISTTPNIKNTIPPAPTVILTEEILHTNELGEIFPALRIVYDIQDAPIPLQSVVVELKDSGGNVVKNVIEYSTSINDIIVYPIKNNTTYSGKLYTVSEKKVSSNITGFSHSTNFLFDLDIPSNLRFTKEISSSIKVIWDKVEYYLPVSYKVNRFDEATGELKNTYITDNTYIQLPDYFTSDIFDIQAFVDYTGYYNESLISEAVQCPYGNYIDPEFDTTIEYDSITGDMIVTLPIGVTYSKAVIFPNFLELPDVSETAFQNEGLKKIPYSTYFSNNVELVSRILLYNQNNQVIYDKGFSSEIPAPSITDLDITVEEDKINIIVNSTFPIASGDITVKDETNASILTSNFSSNSFSISFGSVEYFSNMSTIYFDIAYTDLLGRPTNITHFSYVYRVDDVSNVTYSIEKVGIVLKWEDVNDFLTSKYKIFVNDVLWKTTSSTSEIYPVTGTGTYTFKIVTVGVNKLQSPGVLLPVTIGKPNIPSSLQFSKTEFGTIKLSWDAVTYILPINYRVYRITDTETQIIETKDTYYDLQDYFSSDSFKVEAFSTLSNGEIKSDATSIIQCPYDEQLLTIEEVIYGSDGISLTIKNNSSITYKGFELRDGIYWDTATPIGVFSSNILKLPSSYNTAGTYSLIVSGITNKGNYGSTFDYDLTVAPLKVNDILLTYTQEGVLLELDYTGKFPISEVIWKYGSYSDTLESSKYISSSSTKTLLDTTVKETNEFYYFVKVVDVVGRESNIFKKYVKIDAPNSPTNLSIEIEQATQKVILKWGPPVLEEGNLPIDKYRIIYLGNEFFSTETEFILPSLQNNTVIKLQAIDVYGNYSNVVEYPINIDLPNDITEFSVHQNGDFLLFSWNKVTNTLIKGYEIRRGSWNLGTFVGVYYDNNAIVPVTSSGEVTYYIKPISITNEYSKNPKSFNIKVFSTIFTNEFLKYQGTVTNWEGATFNSLVTFDNTLTVKDLSRGYLALIPNQFTYEDIVRSKNYYQISAVASDKASYTWDNATFAWDSATFPYQSVIDTPLSFIPQLIKELKNKNSFITDEYTLNDTLTSKWLLNSPSVSDMSKVSFEYGVFSKGVNLTGIADIQFTTATDYLSMFIKIKNINTLLGNIFDGTSKVYIDLIEEGVQVRYTNNSFILPINMNSDDSILLGIYKNITDYTLIVKNIYTGQSASVIKTLPITNLNNFIFGGI
jgi:sulfur carrier protein ThiS